MILHVLFFFFSLYSLRSSVGANIVWLLSLGYIVDYFIKKVSYLMG